MEMNVVSSTCAAAEGKAKHLQAKVTALEARLNQYSGIADQLDTKFKEMAEEKRARACWLTFSTLFVKRCV